MVEVRSPQVLAAQVAVVLSAGLLLGDAPRLSGRHAALYRQARRRARQLEAIIDINRRLTLGPDLGEVLARIAEETVRLLGAQWAELDLVEGDELVTAARFGPPPALTPEERKELDAGRRMCVAARSRRATGVPGGRSVPRPGGNGQAAAVASRSGPWLCIPLRGRTGISGVLTVAPRGERRFSPADLALLETFADQAAITLENGQLYAASERLTLTDPLTGIANRRHFERALSQEVARADRLGYPLALLLIDVDHFKVYNDTHGHPAGDAALRAVAEVLRRSVRATDLVARYGGEEFAMLLLGTDAQGAWAVGEKARLAVAAVSVPGLTISVGGAAESGLGSIGLLSAADRALYAAKRHGRNRTVIGPQPQPEAEPAVVAAQSRAHHDSRTHRDTEVPLGSFPSPHATDGQSERTLGVRNVGASTRPTQGAGASAVSWAEHPSPRRKRILVVEDDPTMVDLLAEVLERSGYDVYSVATGGELATKMEEVNPDLLIVDLVLPDTDGLEICGKIHTRWPGPIIVVSGSRRDRDRILSLRLGADDFIEKPFDIYELVARVQTVLRRSAP